MAFADNTISLGAVVRPPAGKFPRQRIHEFDTYLSPVENVPGRQVVSKITSRERDFRKSLSIPTSKFKRGFARVGIHARGRFVPKSILKNVLLSGIGLGEMGRAPSLAQQRALLAFQLQRMKMLDAAKSRQMALREALAARQAGIVSRKAAVEERIANIKGAGVARRQSVLANIAARKAAAQAAAQERIMAARGRVQAQQIRREQIAAAKQEAIARAQEIKMEQARIAAETQRAGMEYQYKMATEPGEKQMQMQLELEKMRYAHEARMLPEPMMQNSGFYSGQSQQYIEYQKPQVTARETPYDDDDAILKRGRPQFPQEYYRGFGPGAEKQPEAEYTPEEMFKEERVINERERFIPEEEGQYEEQVEKQFVPDIEMNEQEMSGFW